MRYVSGEVPVPRHRRKVAHEAQGFFDKVQGTGFVVQGKEALAEHTMEQVVKLDMRRRELAGDDAALNALLCRVELYAVDSMVGEMRNLDNGWKL
jgi:hypothetical protein